MGYKIKYENEIVKEILKEPAKQTRSAFIWWFLTACCVLAFIIHNSGAFLGDYFIPGDTAVTKDALTAFAEDVRAGESIKEAFAAFCMEIIENADISH